MPFEVIQNWAFYLTKYFFFFCIQTQLISSGSAKIVSLNDIPDLATKSPKTSDYKRPFAVRRQVTIEKLDKQDDGDDGDDSKQDDQSNSRNWASTQNAKYGSW